MFLARDEPYTPRKPTLADASAHGYETGRFFTQLDSYKWALGEDVASVSHSYFDVSGPSPWTARNSHYIRLIGGRRCTGRSDWCFSVDKKSSAETHGL